MPKLKLTTARPEASRTVDMTPSWTEAARMLGVVMVYGTDEGRASIAPEIERMGRIIDELQDKLSHETSADPVEPQRDGIDT